MRVKRQHIRYLLIVVVLLASAVLACTLPGQSEGEDTTDDVKSEQEEADSAQQAVTSTPLAESPTATPTATATASPTPAVAVEYIDSVSASGAGYTGRGVLTVSLTNPEEEAVDYVIPPGFVFLPPEGSAQQRLMVLKREEITLQPGEQATLDPFVVCIDADQGAPEGGASFSAGGIVENEKLQEFAECLNNQDLEGGGATGFMTGSFGLQFAIWAVSDGYSFSEFMGILENPDELGTEEPEEGEGEGVSESLFPTEMMEAMRPFFDQMAESQQEWLEVCGIEIEDSENGGE